MSSSSYSHKNVTLFPEDYQNISAIFVGREPEVIQYEREVRDLLNNNSNMSREDAETFLYDEAKRIHEYLNNPYAKVGELINSLSGAYWGAYVGKVAVSKSLATRIELYETNGKILNTNKGGTKPSLMFPNLTR